jgi:hypothetical protein
MFAMLDSLMLSIFIEQDFLDFTFQQIRETFAGCVVMALS